MKQQISKVKTKQVCLMIVSCPATLAVNNSLWSHHLK